MEYRASRTVASRLVPGAAETVGAGETVGTLVGGLAGQLVGAAETVGEAVKRPGAAVGKAVPEASLLDVFVEAPSPPEFVVSRTLIGFGPQELCIHLPLS